jgi:hypothetical protein
MISPHGVVDLASIVHYPWPSLTSISNQITCIPARREPPDRRRVGLFFGFAGLGLLLLFTALILWEDAPISIFEKYLWAWLLYLLLGVLMVELLVRLSLGLGLVRLLHLLYVPLIVLLLLVLINVEIWPITEVRLDSGGFVIVVWVTLMAVVFSCYYFVIGKGGRRHPLSGSRAIQLLLVMALLLVAIMPWLIRSLIPIML